VYIIHTYIGKSAGLELLQVVGLVLIHCFVKCGRVHVAHAHVRPLSSSIIGYQHKLEREQTFHATHWPCVDGPAASVGVWLRDEKSDAAALRPISLWKYFSFTFTSDTVLHSC